MRAEGALLALAAGDALGWPQEFPAKVRGPRPERSAALVAWTRRSGTRYAPYDERIAAGTYTDDTQLALAVARSLVDGGHHWWSHFTRIELPLWDVYKVGGGRGTKRAVKSWVKGTPPWLGKDEEAVQQYFAHGGNGVAMRVLPHAIRASGAEDPRALARGVVSNGVATHGHPLALVSAATYALGAWWMLRASRTVRANDLVQFLLDEERIWGAEPAVSDLPEGWVERADRPAGALRQRWTDAAREMKGLLSTVRLEVERGRKDDLEVLESLGACGKGKGLGTVSVAAAVYLSAKYVNDPVAAVLGGAFAAGADTDTVAAMTGGLSGGLAGLDGLPREWRSVQDFEYLEALARSLATGPGEATRREANGRTLRARDLDGILRRLFEGAHGDIDLDGIRSARVTRELEFTDLSRAMVTRGWELRTSDGQTLYVTKQRRRKEPSAA